MSIAQVASNILDGGNPPYTPDDFRAAMPAFTSEIAPDSIVQQYVDMAQAVVKQARWHELWQEGMRLYIAHFLTLYVQGNSPAEAGRPGIVNAGMTRGVATAKTVGGVSVSYDINAANGDLTGWAGWKLTNYGTQFATLSRLLTKAGMYVR